MLCLRPSAIALPVILPTILTVRIIRYYELRVRGIAEQQQYNTYQVIVLRLFKRDNQSRYAFRSNLYYCHLILATRKLRKPGTLTTANMCVCVFSSHPFWTSSSLDLPAGVTQEEGHTGFFNPPSFCGACLDFCREKDSAIPFPRRQ